MKVLIINASPRNDGNTSLLLDEIKKTFMNLDVSYEEIKIGNKDIRGCIACNYCSENKKCVFNDSVNDAAKILNEADGIIVASPVYFASPNGTLISFLDRLFYSYPNELRYKVASSFVVARRGGTTASFDVLNKYFTISGMPIVSGDYWNNAFGAKKGEVKEDIEGLRNARIVAKRMAFLMKSIKDGKEKYKDLLDEEERKWTNFIR